MEENIEFQQKKAIIDDLYKAEKISGLEWYKALTKLLAEYKEKKQ